MNIPSAVTYVKELRSGSSLPLLVKAEDGAMYVLKLHGSGEGKPALVTAWIASHIAYLLGVPAVLPVLMNFNPEIIPVDADPEIIELAQRSAGVNFATRFIADAVHYSTDAAPAVDSGLRDLIFLTDLLLLNIDRTHKNPNILFSGNKLYCLDYALSFSVSAILTKPKIITTAKILEQLKQHIFYRDGINPIPFFDLLRSISVEAIAEIISAIPEQWRHSICHHDTVEQLYMLMGDTTTIQNNLLHLHTVRHESGEEIKEKNRKARQSFLDKFGRI